MQVRSFVITGATIAAIAAPAAQAATKARITAGSHATSAAHKPRAASSVQRAAAAVLPPGLGTPSAGIESSGAFTDSYFDPITIDTSTLQAPALTLSFPTVTQQDGYLV